MLTNDAGKRLSLGKHLGDAKYEMAKRGVLDQRYDLVAHRRQDALDDLGQHDVEEGLRARVAEHLSRLVVPHGDGLDAAAVDFGEVRGVIEDETDCAGAELPTRPHVDTEQVVRSEHEGHGAGA